MPHFLSKYKSLLARRKALTICWFSVMALAFLGGLAGIIICGVRNRDAHIWLYAVLGLAVPVAMWVIYLVFLVAAKDKKRKKLDQQLLESDLTAEEILQLGTELKTDLFGIALEKRVKELGLESIPEWCARDGVLPTK